MTDLIAWWDFEEDAGSTQYEAHDGNPAHRLDSGSLSYISASNPKTGDRHLFHDGDDTQDVPALADAAIFDFENSFTVSGWVRPAADIPTHIGNSRTIASKWRAASGDRSYWVRYYSQAFGFEIKNKAGQSFEPLPDVAPVVDQYHFFAAYFDAENQVVGLQIDAVTAEVAFTGELEQPTLSPFALYFIKSGFGSSWADDNVGHHDLDALSVWNGALTPTERKILRNNGAGWKYSTFPGFINTPEEIFRATFASALGRDALETALIQRSAALRLANSVVYAYTRPPWFITKPIHIEFGELYKTRPGRVVWIEDDEPGLRSGRWMLIMGRENVTQDSSVIRLTLWGGDHAESLTPPEAPTSD